VHGKKCVQDVPLQEDGEDIWTKEEEVKAEWRELRNEKLHDLYTISMIKSRRMRLVVRVARMG
jgi:mRNA-degrading endonuclease HigB of HigAB toxin-antitoxin module